MFSSLTVFNTASAMARHAALRQALVAENMANSDTPGYLPRDLPDFADLLSQSGTAPGRGPATGFSDTVFTDRGAAGVSVEEEMLRSVGAKRQHDRAIAIYRSGLDILRASLGRG